MYRQIGVLAQQGTHAPAGLIVLQEPLNRSLCEEVGLLLGADFLLGVHAVRDGRVQLTPRGSGEGFGPAHLVEGSLGERVGVRPLDGAVESFLPIRVGLLLLAPALVLGRELLEELRERVRLVDGISVADHAPRERGGKRGEESLAEVRGGVLFFCRRISP